jgi:hypothetical protein
MRVISTVEHLTTYSTPDSKSLLISLLINGLEFKRNNELIISTKNLIAPSTTPTVMGKLGKDFFRILSCLSASPVDSPKMDKLLLVSKRSGKMFEKKNFSNIFVVRPDFTLSKLSIETKQVINGRSQHLKRVLAVLD